MLNLRTNIAAVLILLMVTLACRAEKPEGRIAGLGPAGKTSVLHSGLKFTEGPAADGRGNVFFTDIPANTIYKIDASGELSVFTDESNHANGLMFNAAGEMVACEMDGQIVVWNVDQKRRRVLASEYDGKRFNAPNDLVLDESGGVYFTDPHFRAPKPLPQEKMGVYYVTSSGKVSRLIDDLAAPNGVILSPDEKTLYVFPSMSAEMMAYPVVSPGKLGEPRVFCKLKQQETGGSKGADGVTLDVAGNLYITSHLGLQVYDPAGKLLGVIPVPEKPANVTFGGADRDKLYVTARTSVYRIPMQAKGHVFGGKRQ